jgi:hypothetical protein
MKANIENNTRTPASCKPVGGEGGVLLPNMETLCSDAIERIARMVGVPIDLDDPEPALVAAVEHEVAALVERGAGRIWNRR